MIASMNDKNAIEVEGKLNMIKARILVDGETQVNEYGFSIIDSMFNIEKYSIHKSIYTFDGFLVVDTHKAPEST